MEQKGTTENSRAPNERVANANVLHARKKIASFPHSIFAEHKKRGVYPFSCESNRVNKSIYLEHTLIRCKCVPTGSSSRSTHGIDNTRVAQSFYRVTVNALRYARNV